MTFFIINILIILRFYLCLLELSWMYIPWKLKELFLFIFGLLLWKSGFVFPFFRLVIIFRISFEGILCIFLFLLNIAGLVFIDLFGNHIKCVCILLKIFFWGFLWLIYELLFIFLLLRLLVIICWFILILAKICGQVLSIR